MAPRVLLGSTVLEEDLDLVVLKEFRETRAWQGGVVLLGYLGLMGNKERRGWEERRVKVEGKVAINT